MKLRRPWFAGGTVVLASARAAAEESHGFALNRGEAAFEDGTVNYLGIPAIEIGLRHIDQIGIELIHEHVAQLTGVFLSGLLELRHRSGLPLIHIYGPLTNERRGGTIAMNFFDASGALIHPKLIEHEAGKHNISLRTGCHCNPGAGETALHITKQQMAGLFRAKERMRFERFLHAADAMKEGVVRASLGIVSNNADVTAFLEFAAQFKDFQHSASRGRHAVNSHSVAGTSPARSAVQTKGMP